ncbi:Cystathionine beta-lyase MetC [Commensalibacter sp. Nvir]|uniref:cystathionine beta-lyase n=1 Tax=Commensalibacter sp. Nvir TaxID=3069817 RepID=UPI002D451BCC|nr:Cystathionine beta-lyase MetC [Commensalibacter sp. Nvir]
MNLLTAKEHSVSHGWKRMSTLLATVGRQNNSLPSTGIFVNPPLERGSTVVYPSVKAMQSADHYSYNHLTVYGAMGSPNQHQLEQIIAQIEGGQNTQIVSTGLAACTLPLLTFLQPGDHCLVIDSVYGPTRRFCETVLKGFHIETDFYPAECSPEHISNYFKSNTRIVVSESPGSHTFEVQDIPLLSKITHEKGAKLLVDNTWGIGIFQPFEHGADISSQALTKYANGHSDAVLGAITVNKAEDWIKVRNTAIAFGEIGGPDACWLTLRGLRSLPARLEKQSVSALQIAEWCQQQSSIKSVLHPAFPGTVGHEIWKRDFTGASSLFSVVFSDSVTVDKMVNMINQLKFFSIGASWGGYESLVLPTNGTIKRNFDYDHLKKAMCRLHIGLENTQDLIEDLKQAFSIFL